MDGQAGQEPDPSSLPLSDREQLSWLASRRGGPQDPEAGTPTYLADGGGGVADQTPRLLLGNTPLADIADMKGAPK